MSQVRQKEMKEMEDRWHASHPLASMGPVKGIVIDLWWIRLQQLERNYRFEEVVELTEAICFLQPFIPKVWEFTAWNLGFNLVAESVGERPRQVHFLKKAYQHLKKGLSYHPGHPELQFYMVWMIFMKTRPQQDFSGEWKEWLGKDPRDEAYELMSRLDPVASGDFDRSCFLVTLGKEAGRIREAENVLNQMGIKFSEQAGVIEEIRANLKAVAP